MNLRDLLENELEWWRAYDSKDLTRIADTAVKRFMRFTKKSEDEVKKAAEQYFVPAVQAYIRTKQVQGTQREGVWQENI